MCAHVPCQCISMVKCLVTCVTRMFLLLSVSNFVLVELIRCSECLVAHIAHVRSIARVHTHVHSQLAWIQICLAAFCTQVLLVRAAKTLVD